MLAAVTILCLLSSVSWAQVPVTSKMQSFASAIKGGKLTGGQEKTLYQSDSSKPQPGVITEQWFTGGGAMNEETTIRIYIDGETTASIDFQLLLGHGIGSTEKDEVQYVPWGTKRIAHAADGGIHNTYRIPFSKSVKVTATHPNGGTFWYIIRGVYNYPVVMGDLILPPTTRLYLYKNVGVTLTPKQFLTLANVSSSAGALYQVTLAATSSDYNYLEACFRAHIDGETDTKWLSSGTEDFFLSAYYFNRGIYHFDNSGLTSKVGPGTMSAYKFFENDPLLFTKSLQLVWRCGETQGDSDGCPRDFPPPSASNTTGRLSSPQLANTTVTTYTWVYQWTNTGN